MQLARSFQQSVTNTKTKVLKNSFVQSVSDILVEKIEKRNLFSFFFFFSGNKAMSFSQERLKQVFVQFDIDDNKGVLSKTEAMCACTLLFPDASPSELLEKILSLDKNQDGDIALSEFLQLSKETEEKTTASSDAPEKEKQLLAPSSYPSSLLFTPATKPNSFCSNGSAVKGSTNKQQQQQDSPPLSPHPALPPAAIRNTSSLSGSVLLERKASNASYSSPTPVALSSPITLDELPKRRFSNQQASSTRSFLNSAALTSLNGMSFNGEKTTNSQQHQEESYNNNNSSLETRSRNNSYFGSMQHHVDLSSSTSATRKQPQQQQQQQQTSQQQSISPSPVPTPAFLQRSSTATSPHHLQNSMIQCNKDAKQILGQQASVILQNIVKNNVTPPRNLKLNLHVNQNTKLVFSGPGLLRSETLKVLTNDNAHHYHQNIFNGPSSSDDPSSEVGGIAPPLSPRRLAASDASTSSVSSLPHQHHLHQDFSIKMEIYSDSNKFSQSNLMLMLDGSASTRAINISLFELAALVGNVNFFSQPCFANTFLMSERDNSNNNDGQDETTSRRRRAAMIGNLFKFAALGNSLQIMKQVLIPKFLMVNQEHHCGSAAAAISETDISDAFLIACSFLHVETATLLLIHPKTTDVLFNSNTSRIYPLFAACYQFVHQYRDEVAGDTDSDNEDLEENGSSSASTRRGGSHSMPRMRFTPRNDEGVGPRQMSSSSTISEDHIQHHSSEIMQEKELEFLKRLHIATKTTPEMLQKSVFVSSRESLTILSLTLKVPTSDALAHEILSMLLDKNYLHDFNPKNINDALLCCSDGNNQGNDGKTLLHLAVAEGYEKCCDLILSIAHKNWAGLKVQVKDAQDIDGLTPLMWACAARQYSIVEMLVKKYSADVKIKAKDGERDALSIAKQLEDPEERDIVKLIETVV